MVDPESFYREDIYISPLGIALLILIGVMTVAFIIFRNKFKTKHRLYIALVLAVLAGFAGGITLDEYALYKDGTLTDWYRTKDSMNAPYYPVCNNC